MSTGSKVGTGLSAIFVAGAVLLAGTVSHVDAAPQQSHHKSKTKKQPLPPLPSGPTGPVQQIPLDSIAAVPPQVSFQNNELTIVAPNSTLADILRAVRKQTGADIEVPSAPERVVTRLGPGPARDVLSDLLNGSRFNYVLLGAPGNDTLLTRVVLVPKAGQPQQPTPTVAANSTPQEDQPPAAEAENAPAPEQDASQESTDSEANDDSANNGDDTGDQAADADQQAPANPDQPGVKTPQQMLQEMQQRQLQLQQQQQTGQPVTPGSGMPPHPPPQQQ